MAILNGSQVILKADDAAATAVSLIGGQKNVTFNSNNELINISDKNSRNSNFIGGLFNETISLSSFYVVDDAAFAYLQTAVRTGVTVSIERWQGETNADTPAKSETADCFVSSITESFAHDGAGDVEVSLQVTGAWV
tara:strand:- start:311 stop:721 length:411 start_codon:yes stop_codon:yes gene_type:complete